VALLQLNLKPSDKDLRWFAGLWFPAFAAMAGYLVFRKLHAPAAALTIWSLALIQSLLGLFSARMILPVYRGIMRLTYPVGWVLSHIFLVLAYYCVILPVGLLVRLFHDPMQRAFERNAQSYWIPIPSQDKTRYLRQI